MSENFRRDAIKHIPNGYYLLPADENLIASDLVWNWTANKFMRADSPEWMFDTFSIPRSEIICAVRRPHLFGFENAERKTFTLRR
jgi:hypothetical protein